MSRSSKVQPARPEPEGALDDELSAAPDSKPSREDRIRLAAYAAAEARDFEPGHELEDWLEAEAQVGPDEDDQA